MIKIKNPIKSLAEYILRKDIEAKNDAIVKFAKECSEKDNTIERLNELVNKQKDELADKVDTVLREYKFSPEKLTSQEQKEIGEIADHPGFTALGKWFKAQADRNNDNLIHNADATQTKQNLWRLAVLMYEDWYMFISHCAQTYEQKAKK